jgi:hypothetical protein
MVCEVKSSNLIFSFSFSHTFFSDVCEQGVLEAIDMSKAIRGGGQVWSRGAAVTTYTQTPRDVT